MTADSSRFRWATRAMTPASATASSSTTSSARSSAESIPVIIEIRQITHIERADLRIAVGRFGEIHPLAVGSEERVAVIALTFGRHFCQPAKVAHLETPGIARKMNRVNILRFGSAVA